MLLCFIIQIKLIFTKISVNLLKIANFLWSKKMFFVWTISFEDLIQFSWWDMLWISTDIELSEFEWILIFAINQSKVMMNLRTDKKIKYFDWIRIQNKKCYEVYQIKNRSYFFQVISEHSKKCILKCVTL